MNKKELIIHVSKLVHDKLYNISEEYNIGDYGYNIVGNSIILTIPNLNDLSDFRGLIREHGNKSPIFEGIDYNKAIEILFNDYEYGTTNGSNCFLIDENDRIFGISWNLLSHNSFIKAINIKYPGYIVLNNKKRLEHDLFVKDIPTVSSWLNSYYISHL